MLILCLLRFSVRFLVLLVKVMSLFVMMLGSFLM